MKKLFNSKTVRKMTFCLAFLVVLSFSLQATTKKTIKIKDYYPIADGNEWRYTAPPEWKDGDYISSIKLVSDNSENKDSAKKYYHFDATKAAKMLTVSKQKGIIYEGELFNDGTKAEFDKPILWLPSKIKIGDILKEERNYTRFLKDGKKLSGIFRIDQKIVGFEDLEVSAGKFKNTLRIDSETFWTLGDGRIARSINVYHYAKNVGVIKASARFIIISKEGKEIINRLIETDLRRATVNGKKIGLKAD